MFTRRGIFTAVATLMFGCGSQSSGEVEFSGADSGGSGEAGSEVGEASTSGESDTGEKLDVSGDGTDTGGIPTGCENLGELPTNQGCEFWAVDLPNVSEVLPFTLDVVPHDQQFAVVVTNPSDQDMATVDIYRGNETTPVVSGALPFDTMRVFQLDAMNIDPGATTSTGTAYRIESDLPIIAYQFQPLDNTTPVYSNDATILFPTHVLAGDYTAITADATLVGADGFSVSDLNTGAFVSVVATADDTTVTLYPTAQLHPGPAQNVLLQRGQVLTAISSERGAPTFGNLSGTRVLADRPVSVFSGSVATSEPSGANACCADHVEHQMLPLTAWGSSYVAAPAAAASGTGNDASVFRITGAFDGTTLQYDPFAPPGAPTTIGAAQTVAFVADTAFTVRAADQTHTFAVSQFLLSNQYFSAFSRPGDPSMILLPAAAQFQEDYVFLLPQGYARNFVTIIRPAGAPLLLDDSPLTGATFAPLGVLDGTAYDYAHLELVPGSHSLSGELPFAIIASGHDNDVSYGYTGGSGVAVISEPPPIP